MNNPAFNTSILTSYKVLNNYDRHLSETFNRLEVLEQPNGSFVQTLFKNDLKSARTIYSKLGVLENITTYHDDGIEVIRIVKNNTVMVTNVIQQDLVLNIDPDHLFHTAGL